MAEGAATSAQIDLSKWQERVKQLGLDPNLDCNNHKVLRTTRSLAEYTAWYNHPNHPNAKASDLTAEKLAKMPDALFRRHVVRHVTGETIISDAAVIKAVEGRAKTFYAYVRADPGPIVITAANPLIINSNNTITVYTSVTLKDGGYIKILVPCSFQCQVLEKIQGGTGPAPAFDVFVVGADGGPATAGTSPTKPDQAGAGSNAACDCCGGAVKNGATSGDRGTDGNDGGDAQNDGGDGDLAPDTVFTVSENLKSFVTFLDKGGNGGRGGDGGTGAQGGQGGKGGDGTTCGAYQPDGAQGGRGGNGGKGGNASSGGPGGAGSVLKVYVPEPQVANVSISVRISDGGGKGIRGFRGDAGVGGPPGSHGGSWGDGGDPGASDGLDGQAGSKGTAGTAYINGQLQ